VSFNPQEFPKTVEEALSHFNQHSLQVVSRAEFDESILTKRLYFGDGLWSAERLRIAGQFVRAIHNRLRRPDSLPSGDYIAPPALKPAGKTEYFEAYQLAAILDIRDRLAALNKPITVISIPHRDDLLAHRDGLPNVREFARLIGAEFINGADAFKSLKDAEIRACYFPVDGHWSQVGSDRFAAFVAKRLK
jgi:hypothetical protein